MFRVLALLALAWLPVTMTAGVAGLLPSMGAAAAVALMERARGVFTFIAHLMGSPVIALGDAGRSATHSAFNRTVF